MLPYPLRFIHKEWPKSIILKGITPKNNRNSPHPFGKSCFCLGMIGSPYIGRLGRLAYTEVFFSH